MTDLGALLVSAQKVQEAIGLLKVTKGSALEPAKEALFSALNDIVVEILRQHLSKVEVKLDPQRPQRWDDRLAVLQVIYGGYSLKIPIPILREMDGELATKVETKMNEINLEKFVWAYTNCPSEHRRDGVVPMYYGYNGNFNDVKFEYAGTMAGFVQDNFGEWSLIETTNVSKFVYQSCTGSEVTIERQGEQFVVTHTKDVGTTTSKRLRDAGYTGTVNLR